MAIEMGRKYRTREGCEVRLYAVDGVILSPVHGAYRAIDGWVYAGWSAKGEYCYGAPDRRDLIEVKPSAIDQMIEIMEDHKVRYLNSGANGIAHSVDLLITEARRLKAEAERDG